MRFVALLLLAALLAACSNNTSVAEIQVTPVTPSVLTPAPSPRASEAAGGITPNPALSPSPSARATAGVQTLTPNPSPSAREASKTVAPPLAAGPVLFYEKGGQSLWAATADGGNARALTGPPLAAGGQSLLVPDTSPTPAGTPSPVGLTTTLSWTPSPEGRTVAVVEGGGLVSAADARPAAALWLVDLQGQRRKLLDLLPAGTPAATLAGPDGRALLTALLVQSPPAWSQDGKRVAVVSDHEGQADLYVVAVADGKVTRLTQDAGIEVGPAWSPDGQWLAYAVSPGAVEAGLYAVKADGSGKPRRLAPGVTAPYLLDGQTASYGAGVWVTPDTLIWPSQNTRQPPCGVALRRVTLDGKDDTLVCGPAGTGAAQVYWNTPRKRLAFIPPQATGAAPAPAVTPFPLATPGAAFQGYWVYNVEQSKTNQAVSGQVYSLAWAPNGDLGIAYARADGQGTSLVYRHDAGDNKLLTLPAAATTALPVWAPDGKRVAFADRVVTTEGQEVARLSGAAPAPAAWSAAGLLFAADGRQRLSSLAFWDGKATRTIAENVVPGLVRVVAAR
ncbi:MAG: hypothetical protein U0822_15330 [Anaerolineae bacterium]